MNNQPPLKFVETSNSVIDVHSIFNTIQGEGPFSGKASVFVRLHGCNLQCPGCDTEYTASKTTMTVEDLFKLVRQKAFSNGVPIPLVVITGGEPFRQSTTIELANMLSRYGFIVQIETNGTLPCTGLDESVHVVISPKTGTIARSLREHKLTYYKYVIDHTSMASDGLPILALAHSAHPHVARPGKNRPIYIQPMDPGESEKGDEHYVMNVKACVKSALEHGYTLQLQIHKIVGVE